MSAVDHLSLCLPVDSGRLAIFPGRPEPTAWPVPTNATWGPAVGKSYLVPLRVRPKSILVASVWSVGRRAAALYVLSVRDDDDVHCIVGTAAERAARAQCDQEFTILDGGDGYITVCDPSYVRDAEPLLLIESTGWGDDEYPAAATFTPDGTLDIFHVLFLDEEERDDARPRPQLHGDAP